MKVCPWGTGYTPANEEFDTFRTMNAFVWNYHWKCMYDEADQELFVHVPNALQSENSRLKVIYDFLSVTNSKVVA